MAINYEKAAALAERLIRENGRSLVFIRTSETSLDPAKPWKTVTGADTELTLNGVFVPPAQIRQFGLTALGEGTEFVDLISFSEQIIIVYSGEVDLRPYSKVRDGVVWSVTGIQSLRPGSTRILSYVGVRR